MGIVQGKVERCKKPCAALRLHVYNVVVVVIVVVVAIGVVRSSLTTCAVVVGVVLVAVVVHPTACITRLPAPGLSS